MYSVPQKHPEPNMATWAFSVGEETSIVDEHAHHAHHLPDTVETEAAMLFVVVLVPDDDVGENVENKVDNRMRLNLANIVDYYTSRMAEFIAIDSRQSIGQRD